MAVPPGYSEIARRDGTSVIFVYGGGDLLRKQGMALRVCLSCILLSFLPSVGGTARSEFYTKDEMIDTIYEFQNLINQDEDPDMDDYIGLLCRLEGPETDCYEPECFIDNSLCPHYPYAAEKSCLFRYLRSPNGPIYRGSSGKSIEFFIDADFKALTKVKPLYVNALIKTDDGKIMSAKLYMMVSKGSSFDFGRIMEFWIDGKSIYTLLDEDMRKMVQEAKDKKDN